MTLVGLKLHGKLEAMDLKSLWSEFGPRMAELTTTANIAICYSAMDHNSEATGEFDYLATLTAYWIVRQRPATVAQSPVSLPSIATYRAVAAG